MPPICSSVSNSRDEPPTTSDSIFSVVQTTKGEIFCPSQLTNCSQKETQLESLSFVKFNPLNFASFESLESLPATAELRTVSMGASTSSLRADEIEELCSETLCDNNSIMTSLARFFLPSNCFPLSSQKRGNHKSLQ